MKHTYLYYIRPEDKFQWYVGRTSAVDLFGESMPGDDDALQVELRFGEEFGNAREALLRKLEEAPRVCIGQGYIIPGSRSGDGGRHHALTPAVEGVTRLFWDAPEATAMLYTQAMTIIGKAPDPIPGSDDPREIGTFLIKNVGRLVVPIWM